LKDAFIGKDHGLASRVISTLEQGREKIILSGLTSRYTGNDILQRIQKVSPVFRILSRKRGRVGILIPNSPGAALAILTTIALGRVPVILDASLRRERIEKMLAKMNLDFLIVSAAAYPELVTPCSTLRVNMSGSLVSLDTKKIKWGNANLPREGTAVILYTSGSSGEPKGVQLSSEGISYTVDTLIKYFELSEDSISTCVLPLCHTMGLNTQFLPTFFAGGSCAFHQSSLSLRKIYRRIIESKGTFVGLISELIHFCYDEKLRRDLEPAVLVKHVQIAGGVIREEHLWKARELFPNAVIHKGYGQTEAIRVSMIMRTPQANLCQGKEWKFVILKAMFCRMGALVKYMSKARI
jgi:acyl-CoA synthetase (AMP-forming)/AMP-acid ligase II